jgi:hypothetical protein
LILHNNSTSGAPRQRPFRVAYVARNSYVLSTGPSSSRRLHATRVRHSQIPRPALGSSKR